MENFLIYSTHGLQDEKHCVRGDLKDSNWIHLGQNTANWEVADCFTRIEEVEMAAREHLRMHESSVFRDENFKLCQVGAGA